MQVNGKPATVQKVGAQWGRMKRNRMLILFLTIKAFSSPDRVEHRSMDATAFSRAKLHVPAKGH
jgi:hypothetical protein